MRRRPFIPVLLSVLLPGLAQTETLHVPGEYPTIQAGVDAAEPGDTVLVAAGNYSGPSMEGCLVSGNRAEHGGGVYAYNLGDVSIRSSTITGNFADMFGGGAYLFELYMMSIERSIIRGNCAVSLGSDIYGGAIQPISVVCSAVDTLGITYPDAFEFIGEQVYSDPLFCDPESCDAAPTVGGDYSLMSGSPCLPENSPCGELIGAFGLGCPSSSLPGGMASVSQPVILSQPKPNPSTGLVAFDLNLARAEWVRVGVYDVRGRLVERLVDGVVRRGLHSISWEAPRRGSGLCSGVYYIRGRSGSENVTRKVIVIH